MWIAKLEDIAHSCSSQQHQQPKAVRLREKDVRVSDLISGKETGGVNKVVFHSYPDGQSITISTTLIVPTTLEVGRNYILIWVFFVQSILAYRYIHRRELRLVLLESLYSVEYGIKKIFLIFVFDRDISKFKLSRK